MDWACVGVMNFRRYGHMEALCISLGRCRRVALIPASRWHHCSVGSDLISFRCCFAVEKKHVERD